VVIVTKYRKEVFNEGIFAYFKLKLAEVTEHYPTIRFKNVNHDKDHLHLLVSIPPTMSVGKVVGLVKQNTSRELKQKFPFLKTVYWNDAIWSEGYFVTTVGINEAMIKKYIDEQGKKDSGQTRLGFA
jgi:putative transposase